MSDLPSASCVALDQPDLARRFGGVARLYGAEGAARIANAHVAVVGIGGVGSWAAEALARSGVGRLSLIDLDHVAESNLNRQIHATDVTLGMAKVQAMAERIATFHPTCAVTLIDDFVTPDNWPQLLPPGVDAVIDACDQLPAKQAMAAWAMRQRAAFVTVGAAGGKRLAQGVEVADLAHVSHDPLLAKLRYQLRRYHGAPRDGRIGIDCVFSREAVRQQAAGAAATSGGLNCHGYGSLVSVTAVFGLCAAGWILQKVAEGTDRPIS